MPLLLNRTIRCRFVVAMVWMLALLAGAPSPAAPSPKRNVLVIYSLGAQSSSVWQARLNRGMGLEHSGKQGPAAEIFDERLDVIRVGERAAMDAMAPYLKAKYSGIAFDAIIAENYHATSFLSAHPELFRGVPRYYVNHGRPGWKPADGVGLGIDFDYERAIETIPLTLPGVTHIAVVGDRTARGQQWIAAVRALAPRYQGRIAFEFWDGQSFNELYTKAAALGPGSAIYMFPTYQDGIGAKALPTVVARTLAQTAKVPVYTYVDSLIVDGVAGGYVISGDRVGHVIGRIVEGKLARFDGVQTYVFDYRAVRRFGLREIEGAQWLHRERGAWDEYRWQIIAALTLILLQAVLITALVRASRGRRRSIEALNVERSKLEENVAQRTLELQRANSSLEQLATTDALTGIGNRRRMTAQISTELERARRFRHPLALLMIDIDHFKKVNDSHGHDAGDRAIVAVARALSVGLRASDSAARFGGEEFVVLMPESDLAVAREAGERLRASIAALCLEGEQGQPIALTISVGVAQYAPQGQAGTLGTPSALLSRADRALYQAKSEGRNRVVCESAA